MDRVLLGQPEIPGSYSARVKVPDYTKPMPRPYQGEEDHSETVLDAQTAILIGDLSDIFEVYEERPSR